MMLTGLNQALTRFPWDDAEGAAVDVLVQLSGTTKGCQRAFTEIQYIPRLRNLLQV